MENSSIGIIILGSDYSGVEILSNKLRETLHIDIIDCCINQSNPNSIYQNKLNTILNNQPQRGLIFNHISSESDLEKIIDWHKQNHYELIFLYINNDEEFILNILKQIYECPDCKQLYNLSFFKIEDYLCLEDRHPLNLVKIVPDKSLSEEIKKNEKLSKIVIEKGFKLHEFNNQSNFKLLSRKIFEIVSKKCFQEPDLAKQYFIFKDSAEQLNIPFIIVSGACSYFYYGKRSLKDIDVIVPSKQDLERLGGVFKEETLWSKGTHAQMNYLNLKEIDVNSDVQIINKEKIISFNWSFLENNSLKINFMGEPVKIMSPELLILFKFCIGRFGIDDFNDYKDDFEDVRGVFISQFIDFKKLKMLAKEIHAEEKLEYGLKLLNINK